MPNQVQSRQQERCCGVYLLHTFEKNCKPRVLSDWAPNEIKFYGIDQGYVDRWNTTNLAETDEQYLKRIEGRLKYYIKEFWLKKSYFLAHLNEEEDKVLKDIFLDLGWKVLVPMTRNPTGSKIITYIYHLLPEENAKEVKSILPARRRVRPIEHKLAPKVVS